MKNFTIKMKAGTPVPAKETTYMCQLVKLPDDKEYHIIGTKSKIDNLQVAHHIIIYGCEDAGKFKTFINISTFINQKENTRK